ncbi:hypothetical protein [Halalkalicoccus tibetensis]|uniref:Uncharacterized protein n=1 Tax=Halalkalicoccus tibetensis TaxID=175632 RepID=A0ABD5UYI9_9EURY
MSSPTTPKANRRARPADPPPRKRVSGRKTCPAYTSSRRSWYGWGSTGSGEKSAFGQFLHDTPYLFAEIAVLALPTLV